MEGGKVRWHQSVMNDEDGKINKLLPQTSCPAVFVSLLLDGNNRSDRYDTARAVRVPIYIVMLLPVLGAHTHTHTEGRMQSK